MDKILSVAVPAYNVDAYISQCLRHFIDESIMGLVEIIVINDGSTDNTKELAESYQLRYPILFQVITKANGGHGSAVNCALQTASGKYFMIVDGDDWVTTDAFASLVHKLKKYDLDLGIFHYRRVDVTAKTSAIVQFPKVKFEVDYSFQQLNRKKPYFVLSSLCYRTSLLKENRIMLLEHCYYVDLQYIVHPMCYVDKIKFFNLVLYNYRIGNMDQSVYLPNMVSRYHEHEKVVKDIILYYQIHSQTKFQKEYIQNVLIKAIYTQYHLALTYDCNLQRATRRAKKFDAYLKDTDCDLYRKIGHRIFMLPYLRQHNFNLPRYRKSFLLNFKKAICTFMKGKLII